MRVLVLAALGLLAVTAAGGQTPGTVGSREGNEQNRIDNGVQGGQLTNRESSSL